MFAANVYKLLQSSLAQLARNSIIQTLKWKLNATGLAKSGTFLKSAGNDSRKVRMCLTLVLLTVVGR